MELCGTSEACLVVLEMLFLDSRISRQKSDLELGNHLIDRNVIVLVRVLVGRFVKFGIGEESGIKINTVESTIS